MSDKKTDAWMPLWIGAYLADTMHLTTAQHGAYFLLLIAYWRERSPLVDDDDQLRGITKMERSEWKRARPVISKFFKVASGVWWHKRVEAEIAAANARSKKASEKAGKAAQARWGDKQNDAPSNAPSTTQALLVDMQEECPTPSPLPLPPGVSEPDGSDGAEPPAAEKPAGPKAKSRGEQTRSDIWKAAVAVLQEGGCKSEAMCRTFMGRLVGDHGLDVVQKAIAQAVANQPVDARQYLIATCQSLKGERKPVVSLTVPSDADQRTQDYLATLADERSKATPPPANLANVKARILLKGLHS